VSAGLYRSLQIGGDRANAAAWPRETDDDGFRLGVAMLGQRISSFRKQAHFGPACRNWFTIGPHSCANTPPELAYQCGPIGFPGLEERPHWTSRLSGAGWGWPF